MYATLWKWNAQGKIAGMSRQEGTTMKTEPKAQGTTAVLARSRRSGRNWAAQEHR